MNARIYVASRATPERKAMWRELRDGGSPIISSWIDESADDAAVNYADLWSRIAAEVRSATALVMYGEAADFPVRGVLVEVGIALAIGIPVFVVLPDVMVELPSMQPVGSWVRHPSVRFFRHIADALPFAERIAPLPTPMPRRNSR